MKRRLLALVLAAMLPLLSGCMIQPDPTLEPLVITEGVVPFGTVQPLPTNTPTPLPQITPTPTPDSWQASDQSTWEDWAQDSLPAATPRRAATAAPGQQSWATSTEDYNAGYPVLRMGSTGSDVSDLQARLLELGYYTGAIDGKYAAGTQSAVMEFQTRNGLVADGIAGRQTQDLVYSSAAQAKYISASDTAGGYLLLKQGTSGTSGRTGLLFRRRGWHLWRDNIGCGQGVPAEQRPFRRRAGRRTDAEQALFCQRPLCQSSGSDRRSGSGQNAFPGHDGQ